MNRQNAITTRINEGGTLKDKEMYDTMVGKDRKRVVISEKRS